MNYTRRHFSKMMQAGAALILAGSPALAAAADALASGATQDSATRFSGAFFEGLAGSDFQVVNQASRLRLHSVETNIVRAENHPALRYPAPDVECVTLRFRGEGAQLESKSWQLEHPVAGKFELLLVPGRPGRYTASLALVPHEFLKKTPIPRRAVKLIATSVGNSPALPLKPDC